MNWIKRSEQEPPKNERFLVMSYGIELMEWKKQHGFEGYYLYCGCGCCTGFCTTNFEYWRPIPVKMEEKNANNKTNA